MKRLAEVANRFGSLNYHDWLQIEQAASGCIDGTSDDWPALRHAIALITGQPFTYRKSAAWLQGFCEGILIQRPIEQLAQKRAAPMSELRLSDDTQKETSQSYYEKKLARVAKHAEKYMTTDQQLVEFRELIADEAESNEETK